MSEHKEPTGDLTMLGLRGAEFDFEDTEITEVNEELEEQKAQAQEEVPEEASEEEQPKSLLQAAYDRLERETRVTEESSDTTRLHQEIANLRKEIKLLQEKDERELAGDPEQVDDIPNYMNSEAVRAMIARYEAEDPSLANELRMKVVYQQLKAERERERKLTEERVEAYRQEQERKNFEETAYRALHTELHNIKEHIGGLHAEVIDDFYTRKQDSFLYQRMNSNLPALLTETGVRDMVSGLVFDLTQKAAERENAGSSGVAASTSAGRGTASLRGVSLDKQQKKPQKDYADELIELETPSSNLDKILRGIR